MEEKKSKFQMIHMSWLKSKDQKWWQNFGGTKNQRKNL